MTNEKDENVNSINNWSGISSVSLPSTFINVCGQNNSMPLINNNKINKLKNIIQFYTNTETMTNNKQQTAVEWFSVRRDVLEIEVRLGKLSPIEYAEELTKAEQQAKEMEIAGKEMSYAEGYKEGYNRAIELTKWAISNLIPPHNEQNN